MTSLYIPARRGTKRIVRAESKVPRRGYVTDLIGLRLSEAGTAQIDGEYSPVPGFHYASCGVPNSPRYVALRVTRHFSTAPTNSVVY